MPGIWYERGLVMNHKRILMIDDENFNIQIMKEYLESKGYEFFSAKDGDEGIKKAIETNPNLVIVDLIMPKKDGFEVCEVLRKLPETSGTPIILMTGFEAEDLEMRSKFYGADEVVRKPYVVEELIRKVKQMLQTN